MDRFRIHYILRWCCLLDGISYFEWLPVHFYIWRSRCLSFYLYTILQNKLNHLSSSLLIPISSIGQTIHNKHAYLEPIRAQVHVCIPNQGTVLANPQDKLYHRNARVCKRFLTRLVCNLSIFLQLYFKLGGLGIQIGWWIVHKAHVFRYFYQILYSLIYLALKFLFLRFGFW